MLARVVYADSKLSLMVTAHGGKASEEEDFIVGKCDLSLTHIRAKNAYHIWIPLTAASTKRGGGGKGGGGGGPSNKMTTHLPPLPSPCVRSWSSCYYFWTAVVSLPVFTAPVNEMTRSS